ncbi:hypothetical protein [Salinibacter ruber]|uniref:hypothetical protein n=1 Tax=Salinibacter ruber TaxID=146919 RepID=UPI002166EA93|nr:hypothetical protein [Salinibacter ruber]MCS4057062.1 hypothetical protein [Salinibacter ruber]
MHNLGQERISHGTLEKLYAPKSAKIEMFQEEWLVEKDGVRVPKRLRNYTHNWKGNIPMYYKLKKCNELKSKHEQENDFKYDVVIKVRPDLIVPDKIPERVFQKTDILWYEGNPHPQVSDKLALSSSRNMDYYSSVWDQLDTYWENPLGDGNWQDVRVGERLMLHHMNQSDIRSEPFFINCDILRSLEKVRDNVRKDKKIGGKKIWSSLRNKITYIKEKLRS